MNAYATHVVSYLLAQSWQIAILAAIVGLISLALRNRTAHIRYLLWLIVLAKCFVPPLLTVPLAVLPERSSSLPPALLDLSQEHSTSEVPILTEGAAKPHEPTLAVPSTRELVALVWIAGAFLFLFWVGGRAVRYTAWLRERRKPLLSALQESIRDLSLGFKFRTWPRIWLLEDIRQPFVWGLLRGSVYLPTDFVGLSGSNQQRSILAHELSHIARFDAGVNLLQVLAQAVYWFHPFVWWANREIRQEREKCCDEMAVAHLNTPPERYTDAIVDTLAAECRSAHPIPSLAIVGSVKDIEERIKTMLKPGKTFRGHPSLIAATITSLIALATVPTTLVLTARGQMQPPTQSVASEKPEQPRFAARTFNSDVAFSVTVEETSRSGMRLIGRTPSAAPLEIPACWFWWVGPVAPVKDWDLLARDIDHNKVPGLAWHWATDSDARHLADFTGLERLSLSGSQITDAGLAHLEGLTKLEELDLRSTQVTDASIEHLKGLTGLWKLWLSNTQITDGGLEHLQGLTGLCDLDLGATRITDAGLARLENLTDLRSLDVSGTQITDAGLEHLKGLTKLKAMWVGNTEVTGSGLAHLKDLTGLDLGNTRTTDAGLEHLQDMTTLEWLDVSHTQITNAGLAHLKGLTGLRGLWLCNPQITDAGLAHLKGLTALRDLALWDTQITDAGLEPLRHLTGLQGLNLYGTKITDTSLAHLQDLPRLVTLNLGATQITDTGLRYLAGLKALEQLTMPDTQITDAGLEHLKGLTGLQRLNLSGTQVTDVGIQRLKQSLPKLTIVRGEAK